jgi:peptide/nickel transport system substrate-binding protein
MGFEHGTYTDLRRNNRDEYDVVLANIGRTTDPDSFLSETLHSGSFPPGPNMSYYDQIDDLIEAGRSELDPAQRCEIYREIQEKVQADSPMIPIVQTGLIVAHRNELQGYVPGAPAAGYEFWAYPLSLAP